MSVNSMLRAQPYHSLTGSSAALPLPRRRNSVDRCCMAVVSSSREMSDLVRVRAQRPSRRAGRRAGAHHAVRPQVGVTPTGTPGPPPTRGQRPDRWRETASDKGDERASRQVLMALMEWARDVIQCAGPMGGDRASVSRAPTRREVGIRVCKPLDERGMESNRESARRGEQTYAYCTYSPSRSESAWPRKVLAAAGATGVRAGGDRAVPGRLD